MKYLILVAALIVSVAACNSENEEQQATDIPPGTRPSAENPNLIENLPWTFLTRGIFHNNMTVRVGESMSNNPRQGEWVRFNENGTYEYGTWSEKDHDGTWFYDGDTDLLSLSPKQEGVKQSEWRVMHKDDVMIWQGTSTYQDNATQMQWLRREGYPAQSND